MTHDLGIDSTVVSPLEADITDQGGFQALGQHKEREAGDCPRPPAADRTAHRSLRCVSLVLAQSVVVGAGEPRTKMGAYRPSERGPARA